ncbi:alpha/beta fold hydrolase [Nocardia iowensis]|uniref:Alpha/beta fold hydrolase n=1 Tax=Nocardia iowensis TaxID=204891 RepID=A0ABX8S0Q3_NOCIO|nr:alpha/beta fold hydrolase [Nocardia iowensis]QXN95111.1 alpha/beta fold hydrolase [Nocardia iowensis]
MTELRTDTMYRVRENTIETVGGVETHYWEYLPAHPIDDVVAYTTGGWPVDSTWLEDIIEGLVESGVPVVRYDQRGAGVSGHPRRTSQYTMPKLAQELDAVIDATAAGRTIYVFGEAWAANIAAEHIHRFPGKIDTLISVGSPSLDMAFTALRRQTRRAIGEKSLRKQVAFQWAVLWYWFALALPVLPELVFATGLPTAGLNRMLTRLDQRGGKPNAEPFRTTKADAAQGSLKYRWFIRHRSFTPAYDELRVNHLRVIQLDGERLSTPLLLEGLGDRTPDLRVTHLDADHFNFRYGKTGTAIEKEIRNAIAS